MKTLLQKTSLASDQSEDPLALTSGGGTMMLELQPVCGGGGDGDSSSSDDDDGCEHDDHSEDSNADSPSTDAGR